MLIASFGVPSHHNSENSGGGATVVAAGAGLRRYLCKK